MKPLQPGELSYRGRRVNPETFNPKGKDLRRLVGKCISCGKTLRGTLAIPTPDGHASDMHGDSTPVVQCDDCNAESVRDI